MRNEQQSDSPYLSKISEGPAINQSFATALLDPSLDIPSEIVGTPPKRFAVYRNNVVVSLMEALAQAYPSVKAILGEQDFRKISRIYVLGHPPRSAMMQTFGEEFPIFLKSFKPLEKSGFFVDLARLERGWLETHHAVDETILEAETLSQVPPEQLSGIKFEIHPAAFVMMSPYPVVSLFNRRFETASDIDLTEPQAALVTRPGLEVLVQKISPGQAIFLQGLAQGSDLGTALESAGTADETFEPAPALGLMLESGFCKQINQSTKINVA